MRFSARTEILAIYPSLNARRFSVRTKVPGNSYQFGCDVFVGEGRNSWRYFLVRMQGVMMSEPKFLEVFPSLNGRRFSAEAEISVGSVQFAREVCFGQNRNSWRNIPV